MKLIDDESWLSTEHLLLSFFLVISIVMFAESSSYSSRARLFPRAMAIITIVSSLLLLLRDYLPARVRKAVFSSAAMVQYDEEPLGEVETNKRDIAVLAVLILAYMILSYLISLLYASPLFALSYTLWTRQPWYMIIALTGLGYAIPFGFLWAISGPIDSGLLL